jgi:hypothetical protein
MADQDRADATSDDALAAAEEVAAREAAAEAAGDPTNLEADAPGPDSPGAEVSMVVRPRSRTSSRPATQKRTPAAGPPAAKDQPLSRGLVAASSFGAATPVSGEIEDSVSLTGSGAAVVNARTVDVNRGGIGRVQAVDVAVSQGGIGLARGERVSVEMGGIGAALGSEVRVTQGAVNTIVARDVRIEQAGVRTVIANNVHVERTTGVLVMIARHVEGDVRTILDWRGAVAFGAAFGVVVSLFRRRR